MVSKNVKMLMGEDDAAHHDSYLARYLESGIAKIVGSVRAVQFKASSGKMIAVNLSVSKSVDPDDPRNILFTGTLTKR